MKLILTILILLLCTGAFSQNKYFVKNGGNDAAAGTSDATAWATITKVNATAAGSDSVFFKRGDTFTGTLTPPTGTPSLKTFIGAYGTGARPVFTGFTTLSGWTNLGGNKWEKAVNSGAALNVVTVNGVHTAMGRYPNYPTQLAYEGNNTPTNTYIIDNDLPVSPSWAGATAVLRSETWALNNLVNISHTASGGGSMISSATPFAASNGNGAHNGNGYFFQNHINTLDAQNEWYYTPNTKLTIYSTTDPGSTVKAATTEDIISIVSKNYITIRDLRIEGADRAGIWLQSSSNVSIANCDLEFIGTSAITNYDNFSATAVSNITVDSCIINHCNSNGVYIGGGSGTNSNVTVTNNNIKNCGMLPGMGEPDSDHLDGIFTRSNGATIRHNIVDSVGGSCISVFDRAWTVDSNFCQHWNFLIDDIGGIYSSHVTNSDPGQGYRRISNNIVINGFPTPPGKGGMQPQCEGIYLDTPADSVYVIGNTISNVNHNGLFMHYTYNVVLRDNTVYNAGNAQYAQWSEGAQTGLTHPTITNMTVKNNIWFAKSYLNQKSFMGYYPSGNTPPNWGVMDSNYVVNPFRKIGTMQWEDFTSGASSISQENWDLDTWKSIYGTLEQHSNTHPISLAPYLVTSVIGGNMATTTSFNDAGYNHTIGIGSTTAGTKYRIRFTSSASVNHSNLKILFNDGAIFFPSSETVYGRLLTTPLAHEFVVTSTYTGTSYLMFYCQNPVTQNVTGIDVHEVTTTVMNPDDSIRFDYNATGSSVPVTLPGSHYWKDARGVRYPGTITLAPYASSVLIIDTGTLVSNLPPVAHAGADILVQLPTTTATLNGSTSTDPDGTITAYSWVKLTGTGGTITSPTSATTTVTGLTSGVYTYELTVTDNLGATGKDTVQVTVNAQPVAAAGADQSIQLPVSSVTVSASGSFDTDGTITAYAWTKVSGPSTYTINSPGSVSTVISGLVAGNYVFMVTVTDNNSGTGTDQVQITVLPANIAPVALAGSDATVTLPTSTYQLDGSASYDPDGTITSYAWAKLSGPAYSINNPAIANPILSTLTSGVYIFRLTVTDNNGASSTDNVTITVAAANLTTFPVQGRNIKIVDK